MFNRPSKRIQRLLCIALFTLVLLAPLYINLAQATTLPAVAPSSYHLLAPLSTITDFDPVQPNALSKYLNIMIGVLIGMAAVLAMIMIVMGGIQYMTSDLISSKEEGKKRITNALVGLLIALGAFLLLKTINPSLLNVEPNSGVFTNATAVYVEGNSPTPKLTATGELANAYPNVPVVASVQTSLNWNQFVNYAKTLIGKYPKENVAMGLAVAAFESGWGKKGVNNNYAGIQGDIGKWGGLPIPPTATTIKTDNSGNKRRFLVWDASNGYKVSIELPTLKSNKKNTLTAKDYFLNWVGISEKDINPTALTNFNSVLVTCTKQLGQ